MTVRRLVDWSVNRPVTSYFFGLLGAAYSVYSLVFKLMLSLIITHLAGSKSGWTGYERKVDEVKEEEAAGRIKVMRRMGGWIRWWKRRWRKRRKKRRQKRFSDEEKIYDRNIAWMNIKWIFCRVWVKRIISKEEPRMKQKGRTEWEGWNKKYRYISPMPHCFHPVIHRKFTQVECTWYAVVILHILFRPFMICSRDEATL